MQKEFIGTGSLDKLSRILFKEKPQKIFLVTGRNSYTNSGVAAKLKPLLFAHPHIKFSDFQVNPTIKNIQKGIDLFREEHCDFVIAVGGGSVIDTAKSINILAAHKQVSQEYVTGNVALERAGAPFVAIPTTSGTGSEATSFAVVYIDKVKYSLAHSKFLLPRYVILDSSLTTSMSPYLVACTGMDALCQAVEAFWSVNSTNISQSYSAEAITLILKNIELAVHHPTRATRAAMLKGANLAGKAINIAKTTACHAISYPMTSYFNIPHGHAVSLTLAEMFLHNAQVGSEDCLDARSITHVRQTMSSLLRLFGAPTSQHLHAQITTLLENIGLATRLSRLGIQPQDFDLIIKNGFNADRVKNNPRRLTESQLLEILHKIR